MIGRMTVTGRIGLIAVVLLIAIALLGPWIAPESATSPVGLPYRGPSAEHWLGTDGLGRDVLSRALYGGRSLILLATLSTLLALIIGVGCGMLAAWKQGRGDQAIRGVVDVFLATPAILVVSVLAIGIGRGWTAITIATTVLLIPDLVRLIRAATIQLIREDFVDAAVLRGEGTAAILYRELLPNLVPTIAADAGLRLLGATGLIASASFLGFGLQPPSADWSLMVQENRAGFLLQPWATLVPALLIAIFCLGVLWTGDGVARVSGGRVDAQR